jgi:hypothetical protein
LVRGLQGGVHAGRQDGEVGIGIGERAGAGAWTEIDYALVSPALIKT